MHASKVRVQNVFGFFTTVAFCVGILTALSVLLYPASPTASVDVVKVRVVKGRPNYYSSKQQEYAFITFDLDADLGSLYTWNTKQVFAWLSVSYAGDEKRTKHSDNEVIIWDAILPTPSVSRLSLRNEKAKYNINDIGGRFLERNATVRFGWNVQPHVGALTWGVVEAEGVVEEGDLERGEGQGVKGKRGEGWSFKFPPIGGKKTPAVNKENST
ncbi:signal peptidase subunit-domain-containing protein [Tricharina praecox]|uniref:signal peptidase subunit-domain-containing protein n=1 Tax=Tricharina praecox TaxID=43433 RepID=UPI00221ED8AD|nr:signal peptidase subunit-domain-containing protein [Tricharina praecox]KAI5854926.1 signal peptidase subunit-domain-containing protein [Tricharina praecox]